MDILVYCGANPGKDPIYAEAARELGQWIAQSGHRLVYGGGRTGLMGILADEVLAQGGEVYGVMPAFLKDHEIAHQGLTQLEIVDTMAERKTRMLDLSDACLALPGGPGTLEEISEAISLARLGQSDRPCVFINVAAYYRPMQELFMNMCQAGFLAQEDYERINFISDLSDLNDILAHYQVRQVKSYDRLSDQ
ncbi:LOG family protein [Aerococcus sanguinicola]|uniref:LOG family protein n=1 Tax=unclassified Aerococcus TaxID=2618060 RepID=UPI0008A2ACE8|nr:MULTISPECIES: TIGR00730 family Rossman fold protein [unclassified Aerococcus]KAB0645905.1 TIGR00730 family Rossman fold protein [Aerococcus sanguinicola]MDK6234192.1 TIGR00730 family Rossman fold protein [Aerococcus sp. UMB10185]MDK6856216.1 TIGR00730 family Rossman fold protein [Aerococcus sp. UMB7533]OFN00868.1 Rossman fold protein, TIGR00730 family [Aerococcus sp. HMSC062A02]OHO44519.1 Rossman fold protein, TIGR00730 family [Aerococcus sp. HMSC035B07]